MQVIHHGVTFETLQGDITVQPDCDAVVNAANAQLRSGGGVAGAIHRTAGPELERECAPLAPIRPGQAVITGAYKLPNKHVIHCLGPVYGRDKPAEQMLGDCYRNALQLADAQGLRSVAFPAISTGAFGYPLDEAASIAVGAAVETASGLKTVKLIRFVLFSARDLQAHDRALQRVSE